jgi:predicted Fe-Mo cluster-binding NifX family protein
MKVVITGISNKIEGAFNPRFGRSDYFILVDTETSEWEGLENPAVNARGGAGPQAVQFIADKGTEAVISGRYGPSAFTALEAAGISAYVSQGQGTVNEVLEKFQDGELEKVNAPTGRGFHGRGNR